MAKSDDTILSMKAQTRATRRALAYERTSGYRRTGSVLDAIAGNLATTLGSNEAAVSAANSRSLDAIKRLAARTQRAGRATTERARGEIASEYGSAIAGAAGPMLKRSEAVVKATGQASRGIKANAKGEIKSGDVALGIIQAGGKAAKQAAAAQLAEALRYRAKDDAHLIAEQQFALKQMRLQAQLDFENQKKMFELTTEAENGPQGVPGMTAVANKTGQFYDAMVDIFQTPGPDGNLPTVPQALEMYAAEFGPLNGNEAQVLTAIAQTMYQHGAGGGKGDLYGPGTSDASRQQWLQQAVLDTIAQLYPQFEKHQGVVASAITSSLTASNSIASYEAMLAALGLDDQGGGPGGPTTTLTSRGGVAAPGGVLGPGYTAPTGGSAAGARSSASPFGR